ncbi:2'-5' RNA ligase [Nocardia amikacinitolerans]|uniref:2'-5' RNA ligase family protein n=1 Tax=Nocardia amikacinitolerans TaxID=756689 RepID=UPI00082FC3B9|nr:2'-5' RNA ligase family protein [Nocardia amikacinitolerans]MCP2316656.1 2'-5' RNA ligase [Nocardia amikacinitolerans]
MSATLKRPFPLPLPASTSRADAIRDNDWAAFRQLSELHDHWTLKAWSPGQSGYYWYLTFDDAELVDLVSRCQAALVDDGIDPVPTDGLHLTVLGFGKTSEVSDDQLSEVVAAARETLSDQAAFDLEIGPLTGSRSAIRFSVAPWDPLLNLHGRLRDAVATTRPANMPPQTTEFRPHLGIGYVNRQQCAAPLISSVAALRGLPPVTARVDRVSLVELRREGRAYRWNDQAEIPLGG